MAQFSYIQNSFSSGELSPKLQGRTDIKEYFAGCEELRNFLVYPSGGATRRPGSRYVRQLTLSSDNVRLIPFVFSRTESYEILLEAKSDSITNCIQIFNNSGQAVTVNFSSGGYAGSLNWTASMDAAEFNFAQSGDLLFLTHSQGLITPLIIFRTAIDTFSVQPYVSTSLVASSVRSLLLVPYDEANLTSTTITPSATSGSITLTASAATFVAGHVGGYIRVTHSGTTGVARITSFSSSTSVGALVLVNFGATTASDNWELSSWSDAKGWPRSVAIFQQRLVWGGTTTEPDTLWGSKQYNFFNIMADRLDQDISTDATGLGHFGALTDADPYDLTLGTQEVNNIQWLSSSRTLQIGTLGAEYIAGFGDLILSTSNPDIRAQTHVGSSAIYPAMIGVSTIFAARDGKTLQQFRYSDGNGSYINREITLLSDDIVNFLFDEDTRASTTKSYKNNVYKELVYQQSRSIVWARTSRNALIGITINVSGDTVAFHKHLIGGTTSTTGLAEVLSITVAPNGDGSFDDLYMVVKRTINSSTVYYLEKIGNDFEHPDLVNSSPSEQDHPYFLDGALRKKFQALSIDFTSAQTSVANDNVDLSYDSYQFAQANTGRAIQLTTTGTLPTPLALATTYYLIVTSPGVFKFATTRANALAGTAIDITNVGSGTHTITSSGAETTTEVWSELNYLEGESVTLLAGGTKVTATVTNGQITLTTPVDEIIVGYPYTSRLKTLKIEAGQNFGTAQNSIKRFHKAIARVYKSLAGYIGSRSDNLLPMEFPSTTVIYTGDVDMDFSGGPDEEGQVIAQISDPFPLSILSIILRGRSNE